MASTTVYSSSNWGFIRSANATYSTARSSGTLTLFTTNPAYVGQRYVSGEYRLYEALLAFDTSGIPNDATVTAATLILDGYGGTLTQDFTIQARAYDFGATVATGDWVSGNPSDTPSIDDYTLLATFDTTGWTTGGADNSFSSESAFPGAINVTGETRIVLGSSRHLNGDTPSGDNEYATFYWATDHYPQLDITYTPAAAAAHFMQPRRGIW